MRKKFYGKKRRIIASIVLAVKLFFGTFKESQNYWTPLALNHKKVVSNQELNSFKDYQNSGKRIVTVPVTILEFQREVSNLSSDEILSEHNLNETDKVILVKDYVILPGADGFNLNNNFRRRHPFGRPRMRGGNPIQPLPPQNIPGFMEEMAEKAIELKCNQQRFNDLSVNQGTGTIDKKSLIEAKGALQAEGQQIYKDVRRPANPDVRLDFEATDLKTGDRIFVDHKSMIDFELLVEEGRDISNFPSHETVAYNMGKKIPKQKERFVGLPEGPKSADEVLHLVDFSRIRNPFEKASLIDAVLRGAENGGCSQNIIFINFE